MEATYRAPSSIEDLVANPLFSRSLDPMLLVDDDRRCVDANAAACLFLRVSIEAICKLTIDDLTAPDLCPGLDATWRRLLADTWGAGQLMRHLRMPDGTSVAVDVRVTPHIRPGRHVATIGFGAAQAVNERLRGAAGQGNNLLTKREREILTLVALGHTGVRIAGQLFLSPATVQTHVVNALSKLGATNRAHGIALALQSNELNLAATCGR